ncbi:unnamed protein product [Echinostoma caproni]|uniref:Uncharacterized protein n=1 Tax=Echinostoma caproni TaxID=27848 RepID=A0A3P8ITZ8_9TREM|nr:unnamed protein product [Echinostoma caproni]
MNQIERDAWPPLLFGSLSKFFSIAIRDLRVGLWPSFQLAQVNSSWLNCGYRARPDARRAQRSETKSVPRPMQSDHLEEKMNMDYLDWATNSKLAAVLTLTSLRVTFHCSRDW